MKSLFEIIEDDPYDGDRRRPYLGQSWTDQGERGKTEVRGLTMRDIGDCIRRGQKHATKPGDRIDYSEVAVIQNALCEVERMMGIFPNVPPLDEARACAPGVHGTLRTGAAKANVAGSEWVFQDGTKPNDSE
jgi:hypothetical protein